MANSKLASRISDQYVLRFPDGMRDTIKVRAALNRRSMNAEILCLIEAGLAKENAPTALTVDALVQ